MASLPKRRSGVVVLLSGGLDSAVMAGMALQAGDEVWPLFVRQGFLWEEGEREAIERYLAALGRCAGGRLHPLSIASMSAPDGFAVRWAVDPSQPPPAVGTPDEDVYLPGRNLALLTQAAALAYATGTGRIQIGVLSGNPFPDATPEFFRSFEATVAISMEWPVRVERPLARLTKIEAIERGIRFPLALTLSCARPLPGARHCGECSKCEERRDAFRRAEIPDPTFYGAPD